MIADQEEQGCPRIEPLEKAAKELVEVLEYFAREFRRLTVTRMVCQPVFEQCEVMALRDAPEMSPRFDRRDRYDLRMSEFGPTDTREVCRDPFVPCKFDSRQKWDIREHAGKGGHGKPPRAALCVFEETPRKRIRKEARPPALPKPAEHIVLSDQRTKR